MAGIADVAKSAGVNETQVKAVFKAVADLAKKERVTIKDFGSFQVKTQAARTGINPKTQEPIQIPAKDVLKFSAASAQKS